MNTRRRLWQAGSRLAVWAGVLVLSGLLAATLIRLAPGFGMDERLLDARLSSGTREALIEQRSGQADVLRYYRDYLLRLAHGDLGNSISLGRPVRDLLGERLAVSCRSALAGLGLAWFLSLAAVAALEWRRRRFAEFAASMLSGALLCLPASLAALLCIYLGGGAAAAIAAILLPRIFRYLRNLFRQAGDAGHVLAAHAAGLPQGRLLWYYVAVPVLPELLALGGVSVSMALGATIPVEALCDSPGVGHLVWQAALSRDVPVLVNVTLLITALTTGANLLADSLRAAREAEA
jgi:peptide/nickel transport system permease protein